MKKEGPDGANERHVCLATPLSFPVSNYYIVNGAMKPRQSRFAETVARGTRVHASIRPASGGITFSADKPVSRTHTHTHTQLPRLLVHRPRKVIRDHVGHANISGDPFRSTSLLVDHRFRVERERKGEGKGEKSESTRTFQIHWIQFDGKIYTLWREIKLGKNFVKKWIIRYLEVELTKDTR